MFRSYPSAYQPSSCAVDGKRDQVQHAEMLGHSAIILCAGDAKRMGGAIKQLTEINGKPVLDQTIEWGQGLFDAITVVHIAPELKRPGAGSFQLLSHTRSKIETMLAARALAGDTRTTWLLGDVVWTEPALRAVALDQRPRLVCGHQNANTQTGKAYGELFALACSVEHYAALLQACAETTSTEGPQRATLWWQLVPKWLGRKFWHQASLGIAKEWLTCPDPSVGDIDFPEEATRLQALHQART